jgi:hypothetical protein
MQVGNAKKNTSLVSTHKLNSKGQNNFENVSKLFHILRILNKIYQPSKFVPLRTKIERVTNEKRENIFCGQIPSIRYTFFKVDK